MTRTHLAWTFQGGFFACTSVERMERPSKRPFRSASVDPRRRSSRVSYNLASHPNSCFIGLDYGNYRVMADTRSNLVANPKDASIRKEKPTAEVDLMLDDQSSVLHIVDADGVPVQNAVVNAGPRLVEEEPAGSGIYSLHRTPMGTEVLIAAPGFLPACALAVTGDFTVSLLRPSAHVTQVRLTPAPASAIGEVSGAPLSTCPVPVQMLPVSVQRDVEGEGAMMTIRGLPEGQLGYRPRPFMPFSQLAVPGPPIAITVPQASGRR